MKREILCPECTLGFRKLFPTDEPYPGEYVKIEVGLLRSGSCVCDKCNRELNAGQACAAVSMWADSRNPYFAWEFDYIISVDDPALAHMASMGKGAPEVNAK